jgi:pyridoxamine 5'-phosphate oxidase
MTIEKTDTPYELFKLWLKDAESTEPNDPTAACLATVDDQGQPNARMVLIRTIDERGFVFFTNSQSAKGRELLMNPKAALCFHWKTQEKQVRVQGSVEVTTPAESDAYFNSRYPGSRIGSWASLQSQTLPDRAVLLQRFEEFERKFSGMEYPPRPDYWHGFRICPTRIEFWKNGEFRLHERLVYVKNEAGWKTSLLYP